MAIRIEIPNWLLAISVLFGFVLYIIGIVSIIINIACIIDMYITPIINQNNHLGKIIVNIDLYHSIIYIIFGLILLLCGYILVNTNILIRKFSNKME